MLIKHSRSYLSGAHFGPNGLAGLESGTTFRLKMTYGKSSQSQ